MRIDEALQKTGKADATVLNSYYVKVSDAGNLVWYCKKTNEAYNLVRFEVMIELNWQPYYSESQIRPEKAGELWRYEESGEMVFTFLNLPTSSLLLQWEDGDIEDVEQRDVIHNQNGWTRLYPAVDEAT